MGDYLIEGGKFLQAFRQLEQEHAFQLAWVDRKALPRLFNPIIASADQVDLVKPSPSSNSDSVAALRDRRETVAVIQDLPISAHQLEPGTFSYTELLPENFVAFEQSPRKTRSRYICRGCHAKVYGKSHLNIRCEDCNLLFEREEL